MVRFEIELRTKVSGTKSENYLIILVKIANNLAVLFPFPRILQNQEFKSDDLGYLAEKNNSEQESIQVAGWFLLIVLSTIR